jgi:hypothetical protein
VSLTFRGIHKDIIDDQTLERDVEGALSSGKTICCMWAELNALRDEPGIWTLMSRWTNDATDTLLRPQLEQVARLHGSGVWTWDAKQHFYEWPNGSRVYAFGLKTQSQDPEERFGKIRGLPVSRIYISQAEQVDADIASELRSRMRPDIEAQARGDRYRRQLTFDANPVDDDIGPSGHWLAKQFPTNNSIKGRKYFRLSLRDNAHNLPADFIEQQEQTYPREHPKHRTMILGERGFAVTGDPVYAEIFEHKAHVRELSSRMEGQFIEALEIGKHNPVYLLALRTPLGALLLLGGIMGQGLVLDDFLPIVKNYRSLWNVPTDVQTATAPIGLGQSRGTILDKLRRAGFNLRSRPDANAPNVQLSMIEHLAGMLRQRTVTREECIGVNSDPTRWLTISREGIQQLAFMAFAFEGGYTWSKNFISVGHKQVRQPIEDDKYANAMHCLENIALNFVVDPPATVKPSRNAPAPNHGPNAWMA